MLLCQAEDQLAAFKVQIIALKKKLEKAKKARDQAKQEGYDVGVAETKEAFRAEVSGVYRNCYLQVWNEALNQARVEAFSALRRVESVYYPPTIHTPGSTSSKADPSPEVTKLGKGSPTKALPYSGSLSKEAQQ